MANEPKKRSITGKLVANVLTEREDDFTCNVTYVANRSIKDLCRIRAAKGSKYTAAEYESMCNDLEETAKEEMYLLPLVALIRQRSLIERFAT